MAENKAILANIFHYLGLKKLSVFVGAGVSNLSGFPSWSSLVQNMADEIGCTYNKNDNGNAIFSSEELLKIPQMYFLDRGQALYRAKVEKNFQNNCTPNEIHDLILSLHPNHILTTNYDTLLEDTSIKFGRNFSVLNSDQVVSKGDTANYIIKVHGDFSSDFVLKEQDYLDYENNYVLIDKLVKTIFATNLVIFIGYGLNDYNIKLIINWVKNVQSDSFIMPVFIHTGERLTDIERAYQKGRGLRVLDCNDYTDSNDYTAKYKSVLTEILSYNEKCDLLDKTKKLQYIYDKISGVKNLNYIRREDFSSIFNNEYEIDNFWRIINKSEEQLNYFEDFYNNEKDYESINKNQYNNIKEFLQKAEINKKEETLSVKNLNINNPAFLKQYEEMKAFCLLDYTDIGNNYRKAYYLAQLCEYEKSYNLYTDVLKKSKQNSEWDIYYFAQINRHYLFLIIKQIKKRTSDFNGSITFGKQLKIFDDNFIKRLHHEMTNILLEEQFSELPYEFRKIYTSLSDFSQENCYLKKYYTLTQDKYKIEKLLEKYSFNFQLSDFDKLKLSMLETTKFLYENMVLFTDFIQNNLYVKIAMISWLEAYAKEILGVKSDWSEIIPNTKYAFTFTDIVLISKNFDLDDIDYLSNKIDLWKLPFNETEKLENYINEQIKNYSNIFKLNDLEILIWKQYSNEILLLLLIALHFIKNNDCKLNAVKLIINMTSRHFNVLNRIKILNKWIINSNIKNISSIIENWLFQKINLILKNEVHVTIIEKASNDIYLISNLLYDVIKLEEYDVSKISILVINNKHNCNIKYLENLYIVLNDEARKVFDAYYKITDVFKLIERGYLDCLPYDCNQVQIIENYLDKILEEREENKKKRQKIHTFPSQNQKIANVATYMLIKNFPHEITIKYKGICDEYDFLLYPSDFSKSKFKIEWLFTYYNDLYAKLKECDTQKEIIIDFIDEAFTNTQLNQKESKRLFDIYKIMNSSDS